MTKMLTMDELFVLANDNELGQEAMDIIAQVDVLATKLGRLIADKLKVRSGVGSTDMGGTMVGFGPLNDGDPMPDEFNDFDPEGDWD